MKKGLLVFGFMVICLTGSAHADVADVWSITGGKVSPSTAKKADGTIITADPSQEVLLTLKLKTKSSYGNSDERTIKSKQVTAPEGDKTGAIKIEIQTDGENECAMAQSGGGMLIGSVGPASAIAQIALKPGNYDLYVDNILYGNMNIMEKEATVEMAINYIKLAQQRVDTETSKIFGDIANLTINGKACTVKFKQVGDDVVAEYEFHMSQEALSNGDTLIHKEVKGSVKLQSSWTSSSCRNKNELDWRMQIRGEKRAEIELTKYDSSPPSISFRIEGKSCYK